MKRSLLIVSVLGAAVFTLAGAGSTGPKGPRSPERTEHDYDLIGERASLYLNRHGDNGRIDPSRRLEIVKSEYEARRARKSAEPPESVAGDTWLSIGPTNGAGRATAIATDPAKPGTIYIGAADGGVWKTTDGGNTWAPLTDAINDLAVGALAVAPSSPSVIYLGTGEGGYAQDFVPGIGLLKSTDGGANWSLPSSVIATKFYRISVHPNNPDELVAGTNQGGLRSTDGGATWASVIPTGIYQDVTDIVRDPITPSVMYATTWDAFRWCASNGCQISSPRVLRSTDSGRTWTEKSSGLPVSSAGRRVDRMSIAISPTKPSVLYSAAGIDTGSFAAEVSHIFKSTDAGESWTDLPSVFANPDTGISHYLRGQSWYDNTIVVSPSNENEVIAGGVFYIKSDDGGATWYTAPFMFTGLGPHVDAHDLRYQGSRLLVACDGGIWSSPDNGVTGTPLNNGLVTRQYYALAIDPVNRNRILAGSQDNGTDERTDGGGTGWSNVLGGDGFQCHINSAAPSIAYATIQFGTVFRTKYAGSPDGPFFVDITPPYSYGEATPFFSVIAADPSSPSIVYTASYRLWRSTDGGDHWVALGTTTTDNSTWSTSAPATAFAAAPSDSRVLVLAKAGSALFRTTDGGTTWTEIRQGLPGTNVNCCAIDPANSNVIYAGMAGTGGTSVFKTSDGGASWRQSASGLPSFSAQVLRIDPTDRATLYCGTDVGVYRSTDAGATWSRFGSGLPASSVHDLQILADGSMLRVATHGRGVWELQIPPSGAARPTAAITAPAAAVSIAKGATLAFTGSVSIADGSQLQGTWFFPDTWQGFPAIQGQSSIAHTFNLGGVFPVTLTARDSRGALASATVTVVVAEPAANCATPIVIPGSGPFPVISQVNNETSGGLFSGAYPDCVSGGAGISNPIWFEFTPAATGKYEFTTCGSSLYLVMSLWKGARCGPYSAVEGGCGSLPAAGSSCAGMSKTSSVIVQANAGETLRLMVAGYYGGDLGTYTLTVNSLTPTVTGASVSGKNLIVSGSGFDSGAVILLNGADIRTIADTESPSTTLIGKKAGKKIAPGAMVSLQVRDSDGTLSNVFTFQRPAG